ncbi:coagulation factor 5/8 type domain-containing protein, partial [Streptomyces sp. NPDC059373]
MFQSIRSPRRALVFGVSAAALAVAGAFAVITPSASAATAATGGSGASLPYVEVQAENSATNGTVIGPSYTQGQLADEASYRKATTLQGTGKYVTFTTPVATNSIDFRYSIPDTSSGSVYTAPLSLYINGTKQSNFTLTNAYSWYYGSYPFTNTPGSNPHHFYDEAHRLFSTT